MQQLKLLLLSFISLTLLACYDNTPSYTRDNNKQIVTDNTNNLQWQDNSEVTSNEKNWQAAINYCSNLSLGGYSNWRLPNIIELRSITDLGRHDPAINPAFRHTKNNWYWSSTSYSGYSAWKVDFSDGGFSKWEGSYSFYVRCVRGEALIAPTSYTRDDAKQIVTSNTNSLQWQDNSEVTSGIINWQAAINYCSNLSLGGYSNWRLPNIIELRSILDLGRHDPAINPAFRNYNSQYYWSSTSYAVYSGHAWGVDFSDGSGSNTQEKSSNFYVRCVR